MLAKTCDRLGSDRRVVGRQADDDGEFLATDSPDVQVNDLRRNSPACVVGNRLPDLCDHRVIHFAIEEYAAGIAD